MAQMGQGLMEAGANAARITQAGYESMGKSIAGGIGAVTDAYKQYKDDQAKFDATKKMFKAFGGSLNEEERKGIQEIFDDTSISTREKNAVTPAIMQYMGAAQQQRQALEKQQKELAAAAARQAAALEEERMAPFRKQAASLLNNPMTGTDFGVGQGLIAPTKRQRTNFFEDLQ